MWQFSILFLDDSVDDLLSIGALIVCTYTCGSTSKQAAVPRPKNYAILQPMNPKRIQAYPHRVRNSFSHQLSDVLDELDVDIAVAKAELLEAVGVVAAVRAPTS